MAPRYRVFVGDNFHHDDPGERPYEQGAYNTLDEALAVCRRIVDESLEGLAVTNMSAEALYRRYTMFGDDPFVVEDAYRGGALPFSAWSYAKERCGEICRGGMCANLLSTRFSIISSASSSLSW